MPFSIYRKIKKQKKLKFEMWCAVLSLPHEIPSITNQLLDKERMEKNLKRKVTTKSERDVKNMWKI